MGLSEWFASNFGSDDNLFVLSIYGSGDGLLGFHVLAIYLNGTVLVDGCRDRSMDPRLDGDEFASRCACTRTVVSPNFAMIGSATRLGRVRVDCLRLTLDDTDFVPGDGASHSGDEDFDRLRLVG